jgi:hypothetical protein
MIKKIDKKTVNSTECEKSFECLTNQGYLCKVEHCVDGKVHFLKCNDTVCKFKVSFGNDVFCSCPVRKEIYNLYKI